MNRPSALWSSQAREHQPSAIGGRRASTCRKSSTSAPAPARIARSFATNGYARPRHPIASGAAGVRLVTAAAVGHDDLPPRWRQLAKRSQARLDLRRLVQNGTMIASLIAPLRTALRRIAQSMRRFPPHGPDALARRASRPAGPQEAPTVQRHLRSPSVARHVLVGLGQRR